MSTIKERILVIFKTHLDVGFTDFAENVVENYMKNYLPNAIRVGRETRGQKEGFVWTVGSWLIDKYLEEGAEPKLLEEAIQHGEVRWHGLPFTTHTELMDESLFRYGLGISKRLDERFHMKTIAAKLTDVPGHTKAIIPYLYEAGIRFLHIGVNPASTRPAVPDLFRWRADSGEELVVMYNSDYGKMTYIGQSGVAVYFAHTGDNRGPQSAESIAEVYRELHEKYPEAELMAATLEDVAKIAIQEQNLPVISDEIGDTWIHGIGSDPKKVASFRGLLKLKNILCDNDMKKMYKHLLMIPEHTWGLDEKVHLGTMLQDDKGEYRYFVRTEFETVRKTEKFRKMEQSWAEQRKYVGEAVEELSGKSKALADIILSQCYRDSIDVTGWSELSVEEKIIVGDYELRINESGAVCDLKRKERILADETHHVGQFMYQVLSQNEYDRWKSRYLVSDEQWAAEDFGKIGVDKAIKCKKNFLPHVEHIFQQGRWVLVAMKLPREATELYGGMEKLELLIELNESEIIFDFSWYGKHASRMPESSWLKFHFTEDVVNIKKLNTWIDPEKVVENGNRHMHAVEAVQLQNAVFTPIDAPLVALGQPYIMDFTNDIPDLKKGIWSNLHNNTWGTNFVMWYDEDARYRYVFDMTE